MAKAAIPKLLEQKLVDYFTAASWNTGPYAVYTSLGAELPGNPFMRAMVTAANESPPQSGNFMCSVDFELNSAMDPEYDVDFYEIGTFHESLCGDINGSFIDMENTDLSGSISGYTNAITVFDIRLIGFARNIDEEAGTFQETWNLEIYCNAS